VHLTLASYFTPTHYGSPGAGTRERDEDAVHAAAIVGAGPIGLAVALLLARRGLGTTVIEAREAIVPESRAICISRRSLEILATIGAADRLLGIALPWSRGRTFYRDRQIFEFEMAADEESQFPPIVNVQQCLLEEVLVDLAHAEPLVDLRWGSRVVGTAEDADGVDLTVEDSGTYDLRCDQVVACDGAQGETRRRLGLSFDGETCQGHYVIADIRMPSPRPTERLCWFDPASLPGGSMLMHKQPRDIWRLDYQLAEGEDVEEALEPANVKERITRHLAYIGEDGPWELEWTSAYRAHGLSLESYRHGRVLFAGDAAHLVPIFGVRGLNSGLVDACNLAWKIEAVRAGAPDRLLDTYTEEQRAAALENVRIAMRSAHFMCPAGPGERALRDAALSLAVDNSSFAGLVDPRQTSPFDYVGSSLNTPDRLDDGWQGGPAPGCLAPNPPEAGGWLADRLGLGFTVLHAGPAPLPALPESVDRLGLGDRSPADFDATEGATYLLRPDRHVAARWRDRPSAEEVLAAWERARGTSNRDRGPA
jgi:3-(3-hydroxy-phenyl)propionate hydroxylase